jgi:hypothetical protein
MAETLSAPLAKQASWNGVPVSAVVVFRASMHWKLIQPSRRWALGRCLDALNARMRNSCLNNDELGFGLTTCTLWLHLLLQLPPRTKFPTPNHFGSATASKSPSASMSPTSSAAAARAATAVALRQAPSTPSAAGDTGAIVDAEERDGEEEVLEYVEEETLRWLITALKSTLARIYSGLVTNLYRKVEAVNLRLILGEEGELGSPTFDRLAAVLDEVVALLKRHHCFPTVRHHFMGCLLFFVNASLFNLVLQNKDFCSLLGLFFFFFESVCLPRNALVRLS